MLDKSEINWEHSHNFTLDTHQKKNKIWTVFWLTTVIMVVEIAAGTWSGSMALLADGWHMGTHSAAFAITIFTYFYAKKHAENKAFSFGTGKVNYLGGFASAVALAIVALMMVIESLQRLIEPVVIHFDEAIMVAIIGLIVNAISVFVLHDNHHHDHVDEHNHGHHHGSHQDHNMKAAYFHVLADTLTSILAIVALLTGKYFGWIWMDAVMGIVGAMVILKWAYGLIKDSSNVLLDKSVPSSSITKIAQKIKALDTTVINDIHVWKIATGHLAVILSITAKDPLDFEDYKQILRKCSSELSHITIQIKQQSLQPQRE